MTTFPQLSPSFSVGSIVVICARAWPIDDMHANLISWGFLKGAAALALLGCGFRTASWLAGWLAGCRGQNTCKRQSRQGRVRERAAQWPSPAWARLGCWPGGGVRMYGYGAGCLRAWSSAATRCAAARLRGREELPSLRSPCRVISGEAP